MNNTNFYNKNSKTNSSSVKNNSDNDKNSNTKENNISNKYSIANMIIIILNIIAFVEFHESVAEDNEEPRDKLSLSLTFEEGSNYADLCPTLNYRIASLGSETKVMVFLSEQGMSTTLDRLGAEFIFTTFSLQGFSVTVLAPLLFLLGFLTHLKLLRSQRHPHLNDNGE
ncbi:hypothetical protein PoB_000230600 [Plakobranchus ocellatus]|uniref:Uncharacterized protein n=1 Tax=Plakobranchus ocellatus TaxID=259542 RepID=A0AAV3X914_9GAST|nr:hypothetical protein PoB_000230600 [Plakobranchus ocellatus]